MAKESRPKSFKELVERIEYDKAKRRLKSAFRKLRRPTPKEPTK